MPLNTSVFKTRTLTAIVFAAIMLIGLLINKWLFLLLFLIIHFGCWIEFENLLIRITSLPKKTLTPLMYACMFAGFGCILYVTNNAFFAAGFSLKSFGFFILIISLAALSCFIIYYKKSIHATLIFYLLIGFLYISLDIAFMLNLRTGIFIVKNSSAINVAFYLPLIIILSVWINDTMAYIVGSLIGKTPLSSISPKKTIEGTVGGALLAIIIITVTGCFFLHFNALQMLALTTLACTGGILGDLFESKLKRLANVKDSGSILPGHGGFLDRFDSMLLATGFVWFFVKLFM